MATRIRSDRRRLLNSAVVATMAAITGYIALSTAAGGVDSTTGSEVGAVDDRSGRGPESRPGQSGDHRGGWADGSVDDRPTEATPVIGPGYRTLALDRDDIDLPVEVGQQVEVLALEPTLDSVRASVVAESALVEAVDDSVIVLRLRDREARAAAEALAVGGLALLGTG